MWTKTFSKAGAISAKRFTPCTCLEWEAFEQKLHTKLAAKRVGEVRQEAIAMKAESLPDDEEVGKMTKKAFAEVMAPLLVEAARRGEKQLEAEWDDLIASIGAGSDTEGRSGAASTAACAPSTTSDKLIEAIQKAVALGNVLSAQDNGTHKFKLLDWTGEWQADLVADWITAELRLQYVTNLSADSQHICMFGVGGNRVKAIADMTSPCKLYFVGKVVACRDVPTSKPNWISVTVVHEALSDFHFFVQAAPQMLVATSLKPVPAWLARSVKDSEVPSLILEYDDLVLSAGTAANAAQVGLVDLKVSVPYLRPNPEVTADGFEGRVGKGIVDNMIELTRSTLEWDFFAWHFAVGSGRDR
jgi:hypothetical protein